jgi:hypothetical protein
VSDFMSRASELGGLLWRRARRGGEAAAEAFEQQASIQRLVGQVRKLDRERRSVFAEMGAKVYALHSQGKVRNQDVLVDCRRVDDIGAEMSRLRQQMEDIRAASLAQGIKVPELADVSALTEEGAVVDAAPAVTPPAEATAEAAEPVASDAEAGADDYLPKDQEPATDACSADRGEEAAP